MGLVAAVILEPHPAAMSGTDIVKHRLSGGLLHGVPYLLKCVWTEICKNFTKGVILSFESVFGCILSILILGGTSGCMVCDRAMLMMCSFLIMEKIFLHHCRKEEVVEAEK